MKLNGRIPLGRVKHNIFLFPGADPIFSGKSKHSKEHSASASSRHTDFRKQKLITSDKVTFVKLSTAYKKSKLNLSFLLP